MKLLPAVFLLCLAAAVPADAQVYSRRDASGTLVVSNKPRTAAGAEGSTYAVRATSEIPATRPAVSVSGRFDDLIEQYARAHGVSAALVRAVIQAESGFNPRAVSTKGAMGLMQLMPATARELGVTDPFHPGDNIRGGVTYLARLLTRYDDNVELALAAYNAGPGNVERYGNTVPPFRETRDYVKKITQKPGVTAPPAPVIYKWIEIVAGEPKVRYSNIQPKDVALEIVGRR